MSVYIQQGFITNKLSERKINNNLTEYLANDYLYKVVPLRVDINNYKKNEASYFISGEMKETNGNFFRSDNNVLGRDYAVLDFDKLDISENDFLNLISEKLKEYEYCLYPTISYTEKEPRYRLIVKLERLANKLEYSNIINNLYEYIGIKGDFTASTFSQLQGLPIANQENKDKYKYKIIYNKGLDYPVNIIEITPPKKEITKLKDDDVLALFKAYIEVDKENLEQYNNYNAVNLTLAKAVVSNTISYAVAVECSKLLAMGNDEWIKDNIKKLKREVEKSNGNVGYYKSEYSLRDRLKAPIKNAPNNKARKQLIKLWNDTFTNIEINPPTTDFKNNYELKQFLEELGNQWRTENTTINEKTGGDKVPVMDFTIISKYLRQYVPMLLLGETKDSAGLYLYDFEKGIYIFSVLEIETLITTLENRYSPRKYIEVIKHIKTQTKYVEKLENENLIACNNGIFNLNTKQLEPFTPNYYITSKLTTNYNINAVHEYNINYRNTFDIDNWLIEISNNDTEINTLLWQIMNEAINPNFTRRKFGVMLGNGKNGKGTFQTLLYNLIGKGNIATLKPPQFNSQFQKSQLINKVCNIGDDISTRPLDEIDTLKSIVSGDPITIDRKNKEPITQEFKLFLLFSANAMPIIKEKTDAVLDRLLIIPFNADFQGQKENRYIKTKHIKNKYVLEYVLYKLLYLDFEYFIEPKASREALRDYSIKNDSIKGFVIDEYIPSNIHLIERVPISIIRQLYEKYCNDEGIKPQGRIGISIVKHLNNETEYKYINNSGRLTKINIEEIRNTLNINLYFDKEFNKPVRLIQKCHL